MATTKRGICTEDSDEVCPDKAVMIVSELIGKDMRKLGAALGLKQAKIEVIELDESKWGVQAVAFKILEVWRRNEGDDATEDRLIATLEEIGRRDIIEKILNNDKQESGRKFSGQPRREHKFTLHEIQFYLRGLYKTFTMNGLPWMENVVLSLDKHFVDLEIIKGSRDVTVNLNEKMDLEQVFESTGQQEKPSRILIEGAAGFGKTTIASKLCFDFAKEENYIANFDLVLFFSLRNFTGNVDDMLCPPGISNWQNSEILKMIYNKCIKIMLILDGFDELPNEHVDAILGVIRGQVLPHITLVVTSRPGRLTCNAKDFRRCFVNVTAETNFDITKLWDKHVKIIGISQEKKIEFVEKHLSNFPSDERTRIEEQLKEMEDLRFVTPEFMQCPLFLLMIVMILIEDSDSLQFRQVKTRTDLYKGVMNFITRRYLSKVGNPSASTADLFCFDNNQKPFFVDMITQLGRFSLSAIKANRISFKQKDISELDSSEGGNILNFGVLTKTVLVRGFLEENCYEPVHKSLIEFAAAYFLWITRRTGQRLEWERNVCILRPTYASYQSSLLFPFLMGLMENEAATIFDVLKPYAAEYSSMFYSLTPTMCEVEITDSLMCSLIPFLPITWWTYKFSSGVSATSLPSEIMHKILRAGKIEDLVWILRHPIHFTGLVTVKRLLLFVENEMFPLGNSVFTEIKCCDLVCEFSNVLSLENKWKDILSVLSTVQFQRVSFQFFDSSSTAVFLPLICEAINNGLLREVEVYNIRIEFLEETRNLMDLLVDVIRRDRLHSLAVTLDFFATQQQLDTLLTTIANSPRLTCLKLYCSQETIPLSVDLAKLCNNGKKSYELLHIANVVVKYSLTEERKDFQIELLEIPRVSSIQCVSELFQFCRATSIHGSALILTVDSRLMHDLTEMNIIINKNFFQQEHFSGLSKFRNLKVLTLTLASVDFESTSVKRIGESIEHLPNLKGIEIDRLENNYRLAKDIVENIASHLDESKSISHTVSPVAVAPQPNASSLQYIMLCCSVNPDLIKPHRCDVSNIQDFICLLDRLKQSLLRHVLPQLHIIIDGNSLLQYISMRKPNNVSSFVDMFSPEKEFSVQHDYLGMKEDDSIQNRKGSDDIFARSHRFSVTLFQG